MFTIFFVLKNVIKYNYSVFNYYYFLEFNKINKFKLRMKEKNKLKSVLMSKSIIQGYKLGFYGRFTRKQRAASIWFQNGKMPLNSVSCKIDYGFYTVPLKNSAVSIKVWLYKSSYIFDWTYKIPEFLEVKKF